MLAGCSNTAYNNAIEKGLDYIASEEYEKAESAFELALDEKKKDEKATALLNQTKSYQTAIKALEAGNIQLAVEEAEKVSKEENGSNALVKKAEEIIASTKELQTALDELTKEYSVALEHFEAEEYEQATEAIDALLERDLTHPIYQSVLQDIEKLQDDIQLVAIADEEAAKEKAAKEQAEKEKAAKAEAERTAAAKAKKEVEVKKSEPVAKVFTGERAAQMAEEHYGGGDYGYSYDTEVAYENGLAYYIITIYSKSMRADGGSGTLLLAKVFEDGTIYDGY